MNKIYKLITVKTSTAPGFFVKNILALLIVLAGLGSTVEAQVTLTASAGIPAGSFTTLKGAFDAINSGNHQGDIIININANTNEGTTPATLNGSDADPASYSSVLIRPMANNITVSGNPAAGFGVIQLNGADNITINGIFGGTRQLTISNTAAASVIGNSCIRIATSAAVLSADNNNILNCKLIGNVTGGNLSGETSATGSANISFGIYAGGNAGVTETSAPTAITSATANPAPVGTTMKSLTVQNCTIANCGRAIVFNGSEAANSNGITFTQNVIGTAGVLGGYPYTTPSNTVYTTGIWVAGTNGASISNNTIQNILSYVATAITGIELNANMGTGVVDILNNTITGVVNNANTSSGMASGISINAIGADFTISGNTITTIENQAASGTSPAVGIRINTTAGIGTIASNKISGIFNRHTGGYPAQGINLVSAANSTLIQNNFISNIMNAGSSSFGNAFNANGILLFSGSYHRVYHNSVNLYGTSSAGSSNSINCLAINANTQVGLDIRNNIFSNTVNAGTSLLDVHSCIFMPFTVNAGMNLTLNNNAYYTGGSAGLHGIAFANATAYNAANLFTVANFDPYTTAGATNWRLISSGLGVSSNDLASFGSLAAAPFVSVTDLHIPGGTNTQLESGAVPVGVTTDIDGAARNSFPDIGADEFAGVAIDYAPPIITYTPLLNTCTLGNRTLNVTITDASGVPNSGSGVPQLYWRINAGAYVSVGPSAIAGSVYTFTFGAGAVFPDVVSYYIVAQDAAGTPNVIASPSIGAGNNYLSDPPSADVPPTTPESYAIQNTLAAGTYNIPGAYPTLTAAVNAYNNSCLNGAVIFRLMNTTYPTEIFPIVINNPEASAVNTLTIQPNAGTAVNFTGSSATVLFKLNGADYITIDGLNAGGSSLSITNSNAAGSVIWIASAGITNAATNNIIRNCTIIGGGTASGIAGIIAGSGATLGSAAEAPNSNNTITGNTFKSAQNGIYVNGNAVTYDQNWLISNNNFGSATIAAEKMGYRGLSVQGVNNFTITGNNVLGIVISSSSPATGMAIFNHSTNGSITRNRISGLRQNGTGGGSYGILLASSVNASNVVINNNFIWDVSANGSATVGNNGHGIVVSTGGGYSIYYNSVNMATNATATTSVSSAIYIAATLNLSNAINVRNNIFVNTSTIGNRYAIYCAATATVFQNINYNNYYSTPSVALGFLGGARANLAAWQTATGKDASSLSANPLFVSPTDLHMNLVSPMNGLAETIGSVTIDIDNDVRVAPTDIGADEFDATDCNGVPGVAVISTPVTEFCVSGTALFSATNVSGGDGIRYEWQQSPDNVTYTLIPGQILPTNGNSGLISTNTYFRLVVICDNTGDEQNSNTIYITVNSPNVTTTTPATRCGTGTVNLQATSITGGATLKWYADPTGGVALGTGSPFTTPVIAATTIFYVGAEVGGVNGSVGPESPTAQGGTISTANFDYDMIFDVIQATTLISVDVFPVTLGANATLVVTNPLGAILATIPYVTTASDGLTAQTVPINLPLTPGTGYRIRSGTFPTGGLRRNTSNGSYPYTSSVINITGNTFSANYYYYFYNWQFLSNCSSVRTAVTATVTSPPPITPVATPAVICEGSTSSLSVTSPNAGYTYVWNPGALPGTPVVVTPAANTTYTVTATDVSGGANNGCATTGTVFVQTRPVPTAVTVTPAIVNQCAGVPATLLTATGGSLSNITALSENFNAATNAWTTINNSTGGDNPVATAWTLRPDGYSEPLADIHSNDNSQFYQTDSDAQGSGGTCNTILQSPSFSLAGFTTASLSFWQHYNYLGAGESAIVQASTDGATWNTLATYTSDQGTEVAFVNPVINMDAYAGAPVVYVRFWYSNATFDWHWCIDNVNVTGTVSVATTWTQVPAAPNSMFTNAAATIPYVAGTNASSIYVNPGVSTVYTATATGPAPSFCARTATSSFTVTGSAASVDITAVPSGPICAGTSVTFTANPTYGGAAPTYQWYVNGGPVGTGPTYTSAILADLDVITVDMTSSSACVLVNPVTSAPVNMTVYPVPSCSIAGPDPVCENSTGNIYTSTVLPAGGTVTHNWTISGNGTIIGATNGASVTVTAGLAGSYTLTDNITRNGCTSSCVKTVTVNPGLPVSVTISTPTLTICSGVNITFTAVPVNGGLAPAYQWKVNGFNAGTGNPFITAALANNDVVTCELTSNAACATGNPATSNSLTMTVVSAAAASVTITPSATLCAGAPITFTATPVNGGGAPTYEFFLNGASQGVQAGNTYNLALPVNGDQVYVVMTSDFSCATGNPATSSTYTVTLNPSSTVSITADCNNILTGSGQQSTLTATASGTITTYAWLLNGITSVGGNSATYTTNVAGSYTVTVTNSFGCTTTSAAVVITSTTPALAAGTYIIPSTGCNGFDKISSAVNYINAHGIAGAVIFSITPGYTETAPVGGYAITRTGTVANTITFQRNGAGANPVITAGLQVAGSVTDAVFKIIGADYITIRNLTIQENAANTVTTLGATNTMTEWGVALLYASTTDGPNNNTIEGNTISLNKVYANSFGIYSNMRHSATTPATGADITNTSGGSNKVYGNAINNVNNPVMFLGAPSNMTPGNDIGGAAALTANTITNWGSNAVHSGNTVFFGTTATMAGIYTANQTGLNVSWNSISNAVGINVGAAGFRGILNDYVGTGPTGTFTNTISNNTVTLINAGNTGAFEAITQSNTIASAAVAGITTNFTNNSISSSHTGAGAVPIVAILNAFPSGVLNINGNIIRGNTTNATTGGFTGISNTAAVATTININNNQLGDAGTNAITFSAATGGAVFGITCTGAAAAAAVNITGNSFTRFVHTVLGTSAHTYISCSATPATQNINTNSFTNISTNSNGTLIGITSTTLSANKVFSGNTYTNITGGTGAMTMINTTGGSVLANINNNNIGNSVANSISGGGSITGINVTNLALGISSIATNNITGLSCTGAGASLVLGVSAASPTSAITGNTINTFNSSGNGSTIYGIFISGGTSVNASANTIHTLSGTGLGAASANGLLIAASGSIATISKNRIYNLVQVNSPGVANPLVNGMVLQVGSNVTVSNNFISDLKAPLANIADAIRGINVNSTTGGSTFNIYYNSVYLNATSAGANFGTSAIFHTGNITPTSAALNIRNNIFDNESVSNGTGLTVALRKSITSLSNYQTTSNNNLFFAGSLAIPGLLFYDGTNSITTIAAMQTLLATRESASITARPSFVSVTDLHLIANNNCGIDGAAAPIAGLTDDIDADLRDVTTPDIGADEFTGTGGGTGVWKGINTNWNDPQNWCGQVPSSSINVTIPGAVANYPLITTALPVARNISIAAGASVTVTGAGKLGIYGTITNAGTFNVVDGTIEMAGSAAQTIPAAAFQNNDIKNLVISNASVTLGGTLNLYGKLSFGGSNRTFATAGFLVLKSNAAGTASVGDITNSGANSGNTITGDVSVERFITARRAWRFLSVPTQNNLQTIKEAWQENMPANSTAQSTPAGYGIHITKDSANWAAYGFDLRTTPGPSLKYFVPATNAWKGVTSTIDVPGINNGRFVTGIGYMVLVRGDRSANLLGSPVTTTTLRDKGALVTGTYGPVAVGAGQFAAIGNPYASAVNFASASITKNSLQDVYYLWDPYLGTLGGYVTFAGPTYNPTASVSYTTNKFIESGQAFFVRSSGPAGNLTFNEPAKVDGSYLVTRPAGTESRLKTNLFLVDSTGRHLYDGTIAEFDDTYSNEVNEHDAEKMTNFGENLGITLGDKILSVERRSNLAESDTVFYNLGQVRAKTYQFEFVAEHIAPTGLAAFLEDTYLNTKTPVSLTGSTVVDFSVINEPGSYAPDRFRLVFRQAAPVPVTFTSIRANKHDRNTIMVEWKVDNELNIHHYELERSADGRNFSKVNEQAARGNGSGAALVYNWLDINPLEGDNFYRVRSVGIANDNKLSQVVKVNMGKLPSEITVFPNPVNEDGVVNISISNKPAGTYQLNLVNSKGQVMMKQVLNHAGGSSVYSITMEKYMSHGNYMLNISGDDNIKLTFKVVY